MSKPVKVLGPLRHSLPAIPVVPRTDEEDNGWRAGFKGNCSQSSVYITDGHILLLASAINPAITIEQVKDEWLRRYVTEAAIEKVWQAAEERDDVAADFIVVCDFCDSEVAFLRDASERVMVVNAHLLAFGVSAVHPNALTVSTKFINRWFNDPLAFWRDGSLVALLIPMRVSAAESFAKYDMYGKPIDLTACA